MRIYMHPRRPVVEARQYIGSYGEPEQTMDGIVSWISGFQAIGVEVTGTEDPTEPGMDPTGGWTLEVTTDLTTTRHVMPGDYITSNIEVLSWEQLGKRYDIIQG